MSHTVEVKTEFLSSQIKALVNALTSLGWKVSENSTMKEFNGTGTKVWRYMAKNPSSEHNAYDIGIDVVGDSLKLYTDLYGGNVTRQLGADLGLLKQEHGFHVLKNHYEEIGAMVTRHQEGENIVAEIEIF